ncbi:MAG: hypothetical protein F6K42_26575, partial [Leptolyngbya sp. SIO1D8]|nr:hypothetical protein [Leptolyngbya sp. SIO1D8]
MDIATIARLVYGRGATRNLSSAGAFRSLWTSPRDRVWNWLKFGLYKKAEPKIAKGGIYGSNTSTLPITGLAEAYSKPAEFIG